MLLNACEKTPQIKQQQQQKTTQKALNLINLDSITISKQMQQLSN
jgi:hypothetical protein